MDSTTETPLSLPPSTAPTTPSNTPPPSSPLQNAALVIIDTQNEFLSPSGNFPISDLCRSSLLTNLSSMIPRFRSLGGNIIWVRAIYAPLSVEPVAMAAQEKGDGVVARNEWLVVATHVHPTPCCASNTWGAEIYPPLLSLSSPTDSIVEKSGYSAFNNCSQLEDVLRGKGIQKACFCGVASGTCVLATVVDAVRKGEVDVAVLPDCMGWRRENTHVEALRRFGELGVEVLESGEVGRWGRFRG